MGFFGMIGKGISHFGHFAKNLVGKFAHLINSRGKEQQQQPDYPSAPTPGYEPNSKDAPWNKNKSMIDQAKAKYGGVHINPNNFHLQGLHNI